MQPVVDRLEQEFQGQLAFEWHNASTEAGKATMAAYSLRAHPSFVIVAPDGAVLWSFTGQLPEERLRTQLRQQAKAAS